MVGGGTECLVVAKLHCNECRAKGACNLRQRKAETAKEVCIESAQPLTKPFSGISKRMVWEAYKEVKAKGGVGKSASLKHGDFEAEVENNLYKLWNQMASGCYFPAPVQGVPIPKKDGGTRLLGIPTVRDRVAQMVVNQFLGPKLDKIFHPDSYGYRPNKSAHDAVGVVRKRNWKYDWVLEFDIRGLFDNIEHQLLLKAVLWHADEKWVLLYIERWLKAPMRQEGKLISRIKGTPQGSCVSPLLSNLFLHYAFDRWMATNHPESPFVRYADDGVIHCRTKREATLLKKALKARFEEVF